MAHFKKVLKRTKMKEKEAEDQGDQKKVAKCL